MLGEPFGVVGAFFKRDHVFDTGLRIFGMEARVEVEQIL